MASPTPLSPLVSGHHHHCLPSAVEELLARICRDKSLSPPDAIARRELAALGEEASLRILHDISAARSVKNLSGFIVYMAKNSPVALARHAEALSTQESACFSGPSSPAFTSNRDDSTACPLDCEMPQRQMASPQMEALGELEFRKAFLILSYIGKSSLESAISVGFIQRIKFFPMALFESEVWREIGHKYISDSDRRKALDWDSGKTHVYHCCVDLDGTYIFKGPYLQVTKTHLQRVLGDDNVLLVKFAEDMHGEKRSAHCIVSSTDVYHKFAKEGILVGLRRYYFFVFKDGGKEEKKKSPTSSTVRCYFVRMESSWAMDEDKPYILSDKLTHEARIIFMHAHMVSSLAKYMTRFSLILSKTIKLDIDLTSVHVKDIEDITCMDENGNIMYDEDGEPRIHTDGTGFISEDLAMKCPGNIYKGHCSIPGDIQKNLDGSGILERDSSSRQCRSCSAEPPLLIQFRLFKDGRAVKGTLLIDKRLPPNTILIRPSMIKVKVDPSISYIQSCNSLEVVGTSNRPKRTFLSRNLIALLHHGGVPKEYFLELLMNALDDAQNIQYNKQAALRVALKYGDMDDFLVARMILCGIPLNEPYLQSRLLVLMREEMKVLKEGKLPVSECYHLMGTVDPTGTLKPNEVCIILENGHVSGDVLVYRHPGLHFGDVHILTATYVKGLDKIVGNSKYAILFPAKGPRSLADEMAGGDFDGDMYWVSRNPQLLKYFRASKPWVRTAPRIKVTQTKPTQFSNTELESELFDRFLISRFKPSYTIGTAADCWLMYMDRLLTLGDECAEQKQLLREKMLELVDIYYDALDASKHGLKIEVPSELKPDQFPNFMEKKYLDKDKVYESKSIFGLIYEKVKSSQTEDRPSNEIWQLPCFSLEKTSCLESWKQHYNEYLAEMRQVMSMEHDSKESKDWMANKVIQKYKQMLYGASEFEESNKELDDIFNEALAIYHVTYEYAKSVGTAGRCCFAWNVAGRALCMLHAKKQSQFSSILCLSSVLREVIG
uniref:RNA-dependent RNA polymerase n=1 Tax=Elaeis guineensis var. tenera TaxID=51953 RepID=A0A6J0PGM6_ELAGV|nr:probable RNA-dependent RNA polymerase 5 [Elaeis guineensis]